jgi:uncharacterized OB-fold protein
VRAQRPVAVEDDRFFWDGVAEGRLLLRRCADCGRLQHPPTPMCPACGSVQWSVQQARGRGTVHTWIVSRHPSEPDDSPRITVVVALEEGPRFVANLLGVDAADVVNDLPVELVFADIDGVRLPQFRPAAVLPATA